MEHNYGIPRAFWNFMTRGGTVYDNGAFVYHQPLFNWLYVTGYPIADPYWVKVKVKGVEQDVMFQAFERRLLTYTPANPAQYQVEMGNVGRHYYQWRYTDLWAAIRLQLPTLNRTPPSKAPCWCRASRTARLLKPLLRYG